jgi:hypothetical protein
VKVDNFLCAAYNTAMVALTALDKAGTTDVDTWKAAVLEIGEYEGLDNKIKIRAEDRNIERPYFIAMDNGQREFLVIDIPPIVK